MPTPIRGQSITAPPKVDATLSNTSSNTVQNQAVANALAGAYDATATYSVGDLCIYDGILYECTTAIATAEAWDATHWKTSNFGDAVSGLNRQLSDKQDAPSTAGTAGQVLGLDSNLNPAWMNQSGGSGEGLTNEQKLAILNCFEHVAWTDASGATYYDELYDVFFPPADLVSISATYQNSEDVYPDTALDDLRPYITVTATYSDSTSGAVSAYTITGTLTVGSSVLTIGYNGKTTTITVTVTEPGRSDMDEWSNGVPYTDLEIVQNSYYNAAGTPTNYNGWDRTEKIYCHGASTIEFIRNNTSTSGSDSFSFWYDENKAKVGSSFRFMPAGKITNTVEVPAEAYYFAISGSRSAVNEVIDSITPYA